MTSGPLSRTFSKFRGKKKVRLNGTELYKREKLPVNYTVDYCTLAYDPKSYKLPFRRASSPIR